MANAIRYTCLDIASDSKCDRYDWNLYSTLCNIQIIWWWTLIYPAIFHQKNASSCSRPDKICCVRQYCFILPSKQDHGSTRILHYAVSRQFDRTINCHAIAVHKFITESSVVYICRCGSVYNRTRPIRLLWWCFFLKRLGI